MGTSRFVIVMSQLIANNENLNKINEINCPHLSGQDNRVRTGVESVGGSLIVTARYATVNRSTVWY